MKGPFSLLVSTKLSDHLEDGLVHPFNLTVPLGMVTSRRDTVYLQHFTHFLYNFPCETTAFIADETPGHAYYRKPLVPQIVGDGGGLLIGCNSEQGELGKMILHYKDVNGLGLSHDVYRICLNARKVDMQ